MCLFVPVLLGPAIKVLVVIKVFVESSAVDSTTFLSFAIRNLVTSLGSLLLHRSYIQRCYCSLQLVMSCLPSAHVPDSG